MSREAFFSGYCRVLDGSRTVCAEVEGAVLEEADCCYGSCLYQDQCAIGKAITQLLTEE